MLLERNDDTVLPGVIVCLIVETKDVQDASNPRITRKEFVRWTAVAGRIEGEQWTRQKERSSTDCAAFWEFLNFVRVIQRPIWIFCGQLRTALTCLGLWPLLASGEFTLNRRPSAQLVKHRQRYGKKDPTWGEQGIVIDNTGTTAVVFYHRTGWKVNALDCANFLLNCNADAATDGEISSSPAPMPGVPALTSSITCESPLQELRKSVVSLAVWHRKQDLGRFPFTISGMALATFRHKFMWCTPNLPEDQDERDYEREAFYQGRTEPFWIGKVESGHYSPLVERAANDNLFSQPPSGPFYLVDARSMYGAVGVFQELPFNCCGECETAFDAPDLGNEEGRDLLATVTLDTPHGEYPVRRNGRALYATGQFTTTLAGPELSRAIKDEVITRWHRWRRYDMALLFRPYSLALWEERLKQTMGGSRVLEASCKALLARLHGKFLQRKSRWELRPELFAAEPFDEWWETSATSGRARHFRSIGHDVKEEVDAGDAPHCFPAIAAWVTSWGREWLRSWMNVAGRENVLYCSTDSLIVTKPGRENLEKHGIIGEYGIGSLRVVQESSDVRISGHGMYRIGAKVAHGGYAGETGGNLDCADDNLQLDTLETVLFVRGGQEIQSRAGDFDFSNVSQRFPIRSGGWVETPCLTMPTASLAPAL